MIYLYEKTTTDFTYHGIPLAQAYEADIHRSKSGMYKLTFKYPVTDSEIPELLEKHAQLKADEYSRQNIFRIASVERNESYIEVVAYQSIFDYSKRLMSNISLIDRTPQMVLDAWRAAMLTEDTELTVESTLRGTMTYTTKEDAEDNDVKKVLAMLFDIAEKAGGAIDAVGKHIKLVERLGEDKEIVLTTDKNVTELVNFENAEDLITRIHAQSTFKPDFDKEELKKQQRAEREVLKANQRQANAQRLAQKRNQERQEEIQRRINAELARKAKYEASKGKKRVKRERTFRSAAEIEREVNHKYATSDQRAAARRAEANQRAEQRKAELERLKQQQKEAYQAMTEEVTINVTVDSDLIDDYPNIYEASMVNNDLKSVEELENWARQQFVTNRVDVPKVTYKITNVAREEEVVELGDTVILKYLKNDIDGRIECVETHYDPMEQVYKSVVLGVLEKNYEQGVEQRIGDAVNHMKSRYLTMYESFNANIYQASLNMERIINSKGKEIQDEVSNGIERAKADAAEESGRIRKKIEHDIEEAKKQTKETILAQVDTMLITAKSDDFAQFEKMEPKDAAGWFELNPRVETPAFGRWDNPIPGEKVSIHIKIKVSEQAIETIKLLAKMQHEKSGEIETVQIFRKAVREIKLTNGLGEITEEWAVPDKRIKRIQFALERGTSVQKVLIKDLTVKKKIDARLIVDGSILSRHIAANTITAANIATETISAKNIATDAIEAKHLRIDAAMVKKIAANYLVANELFANSAFMNKLQAVRINASQIDAETLRGKTIYGATIDGATMRGRIRISLGGQGFLQPVNNGLQINAPDADGSNKGIGVQIQGEGWSSGYPEGMFIYRDNDFSSPGTHDNSTSYLLTVAGYVKAAGFGTLAFYETSINGSQDRGGGELKFWNPDTTRPGLLFSGGYGGHNDIFYNYNGTAYGLWPIVSGNTSDARLKRNITDSTNSALELIGKLQFRSFDWKDDNPHGRCKPHTSIGLIAQEVQQVDRSLVVDGDYLALDTLRLAQIALKAARELHGEIKAVRKEVEEWREQSNN